MRSTLVETFAPYASGAMFTLGKASELSKASPGAAFTLLSPTFTLA